MSTDFVPLSSIRSATHQDAATSVNEDDYPLVPIIRSTGQHPPLLVRPLRQLPNPTYELVYGLAIYRSCIAADLDEVLVEVCRTLTPEEVRRYQEADRQSLHTVRHLEPAGTETPDPITEAESLRRTIEKRGIRASQLAREMGIDRSTLSNKLRLLRLGEPVKALLRDHRLSAAQARLLITLSPSEQHRAARAMSVDATLSVREAWQICRRVRTHRPELHVPRTRRQRETMQLAERISEQVGYPVSVKDYGRGGELRVRYFDYEGLDAILHRLRVTLDN